MLWPQISIGPDSQNQSVIPWVSLCTRVHQVYRWYLLAPGTNIAHHLASLETFTCFEMCYSQNSPYDRHGAPPSCSLLKFSVLQFIFYNHCDVIKVVSLSRGSYPQYQAPGSGWAHVFAPWRPGSAESRESRPGNKEGTIMLHSVTQSKSLGDVYFEDNFSKKVYHLQFWCKWDYYCVTRPARRFEWHLLFDKSLFSINIFSKANRALNDALSKKTIIGCGEIPSYYGYWKLWTFHNDTFQIYTAQWLASLWHWHVILQPSCPKQQHKKLIKTKMMFNNFEQNPVHKGKENWKKTETWYKFLSRQETLISCLATFISRSVDVDDFLMFKCWSVYHNVSEGERLTGEVVWGGTYLLLSARVWRHVSTCWSISFPDTASSFQ